MGDLPLGTPADTPAVAVHPRRRGRTALLIAAAALIGVSAGTAVGYGVQAERPPTALPPLSQAGLAYPAKALPADKAPAPLPASQDRQVRTDGDLRKLIMKRPAGWSDDEDTGALNDGWMSVDGYAREFNDEGSHLEYLLESDIRRVAGAAWKKGAHREAAVRLVQFRSGALAEASSYADGQRSYMPWEKDGAGNEGDPVKGSGSGRYYLYPVARKAGYMPLYRARAVMHRGDIMVEINVFDTGPISKKDIRTLAERQLELL
ncbi:hypothetical protein [Streptomyces sp. NPDC057428]|uniref:hypothetical protein n=1 Tax=Streptomyces sp. NPDC057428 TaxID=3346129 RepID=UPI00367FC2B4